jgi:hypothetical protein
MKKIKNDGIISKNRRKYYLKIHLVLVVKYRKPLINNLLKGFIYAQFSKSTKHVKCDAYGEVLTEDDTLTTEKFGR